MVEATVFDSAPRPNLVTPLLLMSWLPPAFLGEARFLGIAVALTLAWELRPRRAPKRVHLACRGGVVDVPGVGSIRARDLVGATTCRHEDGVSLMLNHKRRKRRPIILDLPNEDALASVCRSLGIGHNGFGYVDFALRAPIGDSLRRLSALVGIPLAIGLLAQNPSGQLAVGAFLAVALAIWLTAVLATWLGPPPTVRMTSGGAFLPFRAGARFVPFQAMERIDSNQAGLALTLATPRGPVEQRVKVTAARWMPTGPSPAEVGHVVEQLRAASDRAHGRYAPKHEPEALAAMLSRGQSESLRDWLARLDTIGVGGVGAYRATAADTAELWSLLEDPEAPPNVRAAAAHLLARADPTELRVRVSDVLAAVRDKDARKRIAALVDEEAFEEEEQREARRKAHG